MVDGEKGDIRFLLPEKLKKYYFSLTHVLFFVRKKSEHVLVVKWMMIKMLFINLSLVRLTLLVQSQAQFLFKVSRESSSLSYFCNERVKH